MKKTVIALLTIAIIISLTDTWSAVGSAINEIFTFCLLIGSIALAYYILVRMGKRMSFFKDDFKDKDF